MKNMNENTIFDDETDKKIDLPHFHRLNGKFSSISFRDFDFHFTYKQNNIFICDVVSQADFQRLYIS